MSAPALKGGLLALLAAAPFRLSTPLVQHFGQGLGALTMAWYGMAAMGKTVADNFPQSLADVPAWTIGLSNAPFARVFWASSKTAPCSKPLGPARFTWQNAA